MAAPLEAFDADFGEIAALAESRPEEEPVAERPQPKWKQRCPNLLRFARECRARQLAEARLGACRTNLAALSSRCRELAVSLPFLRGLVPAAGDDKRGDAASNSAPQVAQTILRLAHLPTSVARVTSKGLLTIFKAKALLTRMVVKLQHHGLAQMIGAMSTWVRAAPPTERRFAVIGVSHAWDDTTQKLREPPRVASARRSTQRVSQTVLVQKTTVQASALLLRDDGGLSAYSRAENFTVPPLEVPGKTAEDLRQVMLASAAWTGPINIEDRAAMHGLAAAVDVAIMTFWPDGASQNARWLKHVCGVSLRDIWPPHLLIDPQEVCLIHQGHRIKVGCLEAQSMIGLLFCFSKLARDGSIFKSLTDNICTFVDRRLHIIHGARPPAGATTEARKMFDMLFDLDAGHHARGKDGQRKSNLWHDVHAILAMDNSGTTNSDRIVHYCYATDGRRCCEDADDSRTKLKVAYVNLFVSRCWPEGTLSRWTHVRTLLGLISAGFLCRGILHTCLAPLLEDGGFDGAQAEAASREIAAESAGVGDADERVQHRARKAKVLTWLKKVDTPWQAATVFVTTSIVDKITYFLMTGGQGSSPTKLGSLAKAEQPIEMRKMWKLIRSCRVEYFELLCNFEDPQSSTRTLLRGMGVSDEVATSSPCLFFLRRHALKMSIGVFRRFEIRLGSFPYKLWVIADADTSAEAKRRAAEEFHALEPCCAGWFGAQLKKLFPSREDLLGPLCQLCIGTWLRTLIFSTYGCEREHASVRRIVGGSVGPARNFSLVARERVLETTRSIHIDRVHFDPKEYDDAALTKRRRGVIEDDRGDYNPLFPPVGAVAWRQGDAPAGDAATLAAETAGQLAVPVP